MSMHLVGPWLSTTSSKKKTEKITKKKQEEFERGWKERNVRLKEMHLPKETFEQYMDWIHGKISKKGNVVHSKTETPFIPETKIIPRSNVASNKEQTPVSKLGNETKSKDAKIWVKGPCSSKPSPVYTGSKMIGIAQMHKSNAVPVFTDDEAKDISKMRR
jgi:hypothetical protein